MRIYKSKGFTLVELLIVVAIIGILAAVLTPQFLNARKTAADRAAEVYAHNVYTAVQAYIAEHGSFSANGLTGDFLSAIRVRPIFAGAGMSGRICSLIDDKRDIRDCTAGWEWGGYSVAAPTSGFTIEGCKITGGGDGVEVLYKGGKNSVVMVGSLGKGDNAGSNPNEESDAIRAARQSVVDHQKKYDEVFGNENSTKEDKDNISAALARATQFLEELLRKEQQ